MNCWPGMRPVASHEFVVPAMAVLSRSCLLRDAQTCGATEHARAGPAAVPGPGFGYARARAEASQERHCSS